MGGGLGAGVGGHVLQQQFSSYSISKLCCPRKACAVIRGLAPWCVCTVGLVEKIVALLDYLYFG